MANRSYTSRRELEQYSFHPAMTLLVPLAAIVLQVLITKPFAKFAIVDLPLIATIFFAVARRSPIAGTLTGAIIGLCQDALTNQPIGVNGMAKCVVGYTAASIGVKVDVENIGTRVLMNFGFSILQSILLYGIQRGLLGQPGFHLLWVHELIRAAANTAISLPIFLLLDRGKRMI
ncbi:rod shape-determining protein MreD [Granulicella pectinivorans]|jgi:rod shape-determining protein MreD|uniref:Rod shape-determining protein MreD n=1 Tax=Granulicella pectinivorans TaxID=474950 RepID=A0A1I6LYN9_9BACT|nr:rod shape-determining protein MreD [Granulicella pectinivorans]SFS08553.1 rod shape-determining protein MreD [Granulicella pectinivorans]